MEMLEMIHIEDIQIQRRVRIYPQLKRAVEFVLALLLLVVLSPVFLVLALAVRLNSPGPIFFRQTRIGKNGKPFTFYKFRSMYVDIDRSSHEAYMKAFVHGRNGKNGSGYQDFKPIRDSQVTKVGRLLRKSSLDELPQLFNIIKGDMSIIGPRPNVIAEVEEYKDWHWRRLDVLPGVTGLAQVNGRSCISFDQIVGYDLEYVENESLMLDLKVLLGTVPAVLKGHGAR